MIEKHQRAKGALMGFIVGDALGLPFENLSRAEMAARPATTMTGFGTHHQPPGTWSDDSSMMLCIMENEIHHGDAYSLAESFIRFYKEGYMTPHDQCFDIGATNRKALDRCLEGLPLKASGLNDPGSEDNGSLMRVVPYALLRKYYWRKMMSQGCITHRGSKSHISSWLFQEVLQELLSGKIPTDAIYGPLAQFDSRVKQYLREANPKLGEVIGRIRMPEFQSLPESQIRSSNFVVDTLEASIWCLLNSTDYRSAVLTAVNLGEDTDTTAALTGALAGACYGLLDIPAEWINTLIRREEVEMMIDGFIKDIDERNP
jgi:ADP-ribosyl-[dinitrogen reductase] hydrolase